MVREHMTDDKIEVYRESNLAPAGSMRAAVRPHVATAARSVADAMSHAPKIAEEIAGLLGALRLYWQKKAELLASTSEKKES